ncbi:hypothetical protein [Clostridium senegalense]|uniref:hypothetical protein n=1 Tax=Clostridium senegalense TaxID=1465809 RepID=UPI00325BAA41
MTCKECYSNNSRVTPLLKPQHCLENHIQYVEDAYVFIKMIKEMFIDGVFHLKH